MGECCGGEDETDYDPSDRGPISKRRCTDVPCLLLLLAFVGAWIGVGCYSFTFGNPALLVYPSNSEGEICGRGVHKDKPYLLFFDMTKCARLSAFLGCPTPQVCVAKCPEEFWSYKDTSGVPEALSFCTGLTDEEQETPNIQELVKKRKCPGFLFPSEPFLGRCIPNLKAKKPNSKLLRLNDEEVKDDQVILGKAQILEKLKKSSIMEKLLADLALDWWILLLAALAAIILSLVWVVLLQVAAGAIVYSTILLSCLALIAVTGFSCYKYFEKWEEGEAFVDEVFSAPSMDKVVDHYLDKDTWLTIAIVLGVVTLIILLVLLFLSKRIRIAVRLIEEASRAVRSSCCALFFPILPFVLQFFVLLWFLAVASFLATSGEKQYQVVDAATNATNGNPGQNPLENDPCGGFENGDACDPKAFRRCFSSEEAPQCVFAKYGPTTLDSWLQVFNLVGLFWLLFFFGAMGEMVLAGAFAGWYWTRGKPGAGGGLGASCKRTFQYHLGSLAFGSLILTAVRMVRVLLEWVEEKLKQYGVADNPAVKFVTCCCKCCLWCLEKFIRYMNRNAYIMTAIYGYTFCKAGRESFGLLISNAVRAATLDRVTDFILFLGKIVIVALVTVAAYFSLDNSTELFAAELNYKVAPLVVIAICTYAIASCFFSVYAMAVDTIFLCFLEDLKRHKGGPYFMSEDLKTLLDLKEFRSTQPPILKTGDIALDAM